MEQKFKYQNLFNHFGISRKCPPHEVRQEEIIGFHFVNTPIDNELNFRPIALKRPLRKNSIDETILCSIFALSLFNSEVSARIAFSGFPDRTKILLGYTDLASGLILPEMGLCSPPTDDGHLDLYEFEGVDLTKHFQVIGAL